MLRKSLAVALAAALVLGGLARGLDIDVSIGEPIPAPITGPDNIYTSDGTTAPGYELVDVTVADGGQLIVGDNALNTGMALGLELQSIVTGGPDAVVDVVAASTGAVTGAYLEVGTLNLDEGGVFRIGDSVAGDQNFVSVETLSMTGDETTGAVARIEINDNSGIEVINKAILVDANRDNTVGASLTPPTAGLYLDNADAHFMGGLVLDDSGVYATDNLANPANESYLVSGVMDAAGNYNGAIEMLGDSDIIADGGNLNILAATLTSQIGAGGQVLENIIEVSGAGGSIAAQDVKLVMIDGELTLRAGPAIGDDITFKSLEFAEDAVTGQRGGIVTINSRDSGKVIFTDKVVIEGTQGGREVEDFAIVNVRDAASVWQSGADIGPNGVILNMRGASDAVITLGGDLNLNGEAIIAPAVGNIILEKSTTDPVAINVAGQGNLVVGLSNLEATGLDLVIDDYPVTDIGHWGGWTLGILGSGVSVNTATLAVGELAMAAGGLDIQTGDFVIGNAIHEDGFVVRSLWGTISTDPATNPGASFVLSQNSQILTHMDLKGLSEGLELPTLLTSIAAYTGIPAPSLTQQDIEDFLENNLHGVGWGLAVNGFERADLYGTITIGGGYAGAAIDPANPVLSNVLEFDTATTVNFYEGTVLNIDGNLAKALGSGVFTAADASNTLVAGGNDRLDTFLTSNTTSWHDSVWGQFDFALDTTTDAAYDYIYVASARNNHFDSLATDEEKRELANQNLNTAWDTNLRRDFTDLVWRAVEEGTLGKAVDPVTGLELEEGIFNYNNLWAVAAGTPTNFVDRSTFKYLLGGYAGDLVEIGINTVRTQNEYLLKRTVDVREEICSLRELSTTEGYAAGILNGNYANRIWAGAFGQWEKADRRSGVDGYKYNAWGLNVGYDRFIGSNVVVGAAFSYSSGDYKDKAAYAHDSDVDNYGVNAYATYSAHNGFWATVHGGFTYSDDDINELRRFGSATQTYTDWAKSEFHTKIWNIGAVLGYDWKPMHNLAVTPSVGLNYIHAKASDHDGYVTTMPTATQRVTGADNWALLLPVEISARRIWDICDDSRLSFGVKVGYSYNFNSDGVDGNVHYFGLTDPASARILSREASRHTLTVGADIHYQFRQFDIGAKYDYYYQSDWKAHRAMATVGVNF